MDKRTLGIGIAVAGVGVGGYMVYRHLRKPSEAPPSTQTLVISPPQGQGTTNPPVGHHEFPYGATVWVTALPAPGWYFLRWETLSYNGVDALYRFSNPGRVGMFGERNIFAVFEELVTVTGQVREPGIEDIATGTRYGDSPHYLPFPANIPLGSKVMGWVSGSIFADIPQWVYVTAWLIAPDGSMRGAQTFHTELRPGLEWAAAAVTHTVTLDIPGSWKVGGSLETFAGQHLDEKEWTAIEVS